MGSHFGCWSTIRLCLTLPYGPPSDCWSTVTFCVPLSYGLTFDCCSTIEFCLPLSYGPTYNCWSIIRFCLPLCYGLTSDSWSIIIVCLPCPMDSHWNIDAPLHSTYTCSMELLTSQCWSPIIFSTLPFRLTSECWSTNFCLPLSDGLTPECWSKITLTNWLISQFGPLYIAFYLSLSCRFAPGCWPTLVLCITLSCGSAMKHWPTLAFCLPVPGSLTVGQILHSVYPCSMGSPLTVGPQLYSVNHWFTTECVGPVFNSFFPVRWTHIGILIHPWGHDDNIRAWLVCLYQYPHK